MLPFQESFHKCEIIHCRYLWTDSIYKSKSNYFIILFPPIYPCNWNDLSSYGLFDSCKLNGITEQQVLQETVPVTGNENKSKVLLAQLSTCSSVGRLTKPEMLHLVLLGDTSGSNIDLSVVIWESYRTAIFNLRCGSISITKRRCLPTSTLHFIMDRHGNLWGFGMNTCQSWDNFYFCQRVWWSGKGMRSFLLSICAYSE